MRKYLTLVFSTSLFLSASGSSYAGYYKDPVLPEVPAVTEAPHYQAPVAKPETNTVTHHKHITKNKIIINGLTRYRTVVVPSYTAPSYSNYSSGGGYYMSGYSQQGYQGGYQYGYGNGYAQGNYGYNVQGNYGYNVNASGGYYLMPTGQMITIGSQYYGYTVVGFTASGQPVLATNGGCSGYQNFGGVSCYCR